MPYKHVCCSFCSKIRRQRPQEQTVADALTLFDLRDCRVLHGGDRRVRHGCVLLGAEAPGTGPPAAGAWCRPPSRWGGRDVYSELRDLGVQCCVTAFKEVSGTPWPTSMLIRRT